MTDARPLAFAPPAVQREELPGGGFVLRSTLELDECPPQLGMWLRYWSERTPGAVAFAERRDDVWFEVTWAQAREAVDALSAHLLTLGLSKDQPLALLSDNSVDAALLSHAAMQIGIPVAPISPAYSLLSQDHEKLRHCLSLITPGAVYADDGELYGAALAHVSSEVPRLHSLRPGPGSSTSVRDLIAGPPPAPSDLGKLELAFARTGHDSIAKFLFTSGSTGTPKAVINTQRMLVANQIQIKQLWPFLGERPPRIVDWLPWSHTFGGNHNALMMLCHGGALYVDTGKPAPPRFEETVRNLREISPTLYFNVPRGFGMLVPRLEQDDELAAHFFRDLDAIFYAAAALPQDLWERLEALSEKHLGRRVTMLSAWGATETSPMVTTVHFPIPRAGVIGLPAPGTELAFLPSGSKLELRVKGPNVTPGYWRQAELDSEAFDENGFYKIGDAGRLEDEKDPSKGVVFDGRVAEDFKLSTGVWVSAGALRVQALAAANDLLIDAVVCGHDRDEVGLLALPNWPKIDALCADLGSAASPEQKLASAAVRDLLESGLAAHNSKAKGSSNTIGRVLFLTAPPSIDAGEITDKGYLNQRAMRENRPDSVETLFSGGPEVLRLSS